MGNAAPVLDLSARLHNLPLDLLAIVEPTATIQGRLSADAKLGGTLDDPTGLVTVQATGLQPRKGTNRAFPPANLTGTVKLAGAAAQVDLRLAAARAVTLSVAGRAPLGQAGLLDLRVGGMVDLALLDPVLTAAGRRARGRVQLEAMVSGGIADPRVSGAINFADTEMQDYALGIRIDRIAGRATLDGTTVRIDRLHGRAGSGSIEWAGTIGVFAPEMPVDMTVTARNARILNSDRLTATLDAALNLHGEGTGVLTAEGQVDVREASIRIPERLPIDHRDVECQWHGAKARVEDYQHPGTAAG